MTDSTNENTPLALVPLAGSARAAVSGARPVAPLPADTVVTVSVVLRRAAPVDLGATTAPVAHDAFATAHGATQADMALVVDTFSELGLEVVEQDIATRTVRVRGAAAQLERVFGTSLDGVESDAPGGGRVAHRRRTGGLSIPALLDGVVVAVLGLDDRPQARTNFRAVSPDAVASSYTPVELGAAYAFPDGTDGSGQVVAIIELGGGYVQSDLDTYFSELGVGAPTVTAVGVDGADNVPGADPNGADGEVMLDVEVVGALAPGAAITVYFAPNTDAGFVDAVAKAAHATPTPTAMSISWGQSEDAWTEQARSALDEALVDAAALGVTVTAAAGDNGSTDGQTDGAQHVDFPAASPHVLACGGTRLELRNGSIAAETVWNDGTSGGATGGGVSDAFPLPAWQQGVGVPGSSSAAGGRGVPDVAADADPQTGYEVLVDGRRSVIGGTSAVAPLWAALVARIVQATGTPLGLAQPALYAAAATFHDVTTGDNGAYRAGIGWDACTGLGSPDGTALLAAFGSAGTGTGTSAGAGTTGGAEVTGD